MNGENRRAALEMEQARSLLLGLETGAPGVEQVSVYEAVRRVVARDYTAVMPNPPFHRSPLDGYALSHTALPRGTTRDNPARLRVTMKIYAGDSVTGRLEKGCAARIMTGGMIPDGADCVVRQEDSDFGEETVELYCSAARHENLCFAGEDIAAGAPVVAKGTVLTPAAISALAGQGYGEILVFRRLKVGVISTGSELVCPTGGGALGAGKIYDSNAPLVCARLAELGIHCEAATIGDNAEEISRKIREYIDRLDAVVTTGGVSVGQKDCLPQALELLGATTLFHGVAMKPGSPMLAAVLGNAPILALSGNPFAAFATLELLALPLLLKMSGRRNFLPQAIFSVLQQGFPKGSAGRRFLRGAVSQDGVSLPKNHCSGSIVSANGCNCLVDIPAGSGAPEKGARVRVIPYLETGLLPAGDPVEIPVYAVSGYHKTGKTTVLEEAIRALKQAGRRVAVIKHDGHGFVPDVPGTDSDRLKKAGADAVCVYSAALQGLVQEIDGLRPEDRIAAIAGQMEHRPDVILLEGFKSSAYPKLMLDGAQTGTERLQETGKQLAQYLLREVLAK